MHVVSKLVFSVSKGWILAYYTSNLLKYLHDYIFSNFEALYEFGKCI
jgi:hypothetical protein